MSNSLSSGNLRRIALHASLFAAAAGLVAVGWGYLSRPTSATVQLVAYERAFSTQAEAADFVATAMSTQVLARVATNRSISSTAAELSDRCRVSANLNQPFIAVSAVGSTERSARALLDVYAARVAKVADDWVSRRTKEVDRQLSAAQKRLHELRNKYTEYTEFNDALLRTDIRSLPQTLTKDAEQRAAQVKSLQNQLAVLNAEEKKAMAALAKDRPALRSLQQELDEALARYTDEHPKVKQLRASIAALQKENGPKTSGKSSGTQTNPQLAELSTRRNTLRDQLKKAEANEQKSRMALQKFSTNEVELVRLQTEFTALSSRRDDLIQSRVLMNNKGVEKWRRADQVAIARITDKTRLIHFGWAGSAFGLLMGLGSGLVTVQRRRVIRTEAALSEATDLPVLAALPDLSTMDESAREYWALETLQCLKNTAGVDRHGAFVCGFISASSGEGCSTWIDLLANAGLRSGNRVLVISRPESQPTEVFTEIESGAVSTEAPSHSPFAPQTISHQESNSIARYTLVGDAAESRFQKHWERAFNTWRQEQDAVILVELPPASTADALVLSSALPHVVWLTAANATETTKTVSCVKSLRNTGCNLMGAVLNGVSARARSAVAAIILLAVATLGINTAAAQQPAVATSKTNAPSLAPWQQQFTVGPGDVFDVSLYNQPESLRSATIIGPDGRMSYLQAQDLEVAGLTIDEMRAKLEDSLKQFYLAPRVVVLPVAFHSKKYFILGNVVQPGAFTLDKPTTIVEAIAKARGFVSGSQQRSSFTLADLSQAFLVRRQPNGEFLRESVDFQKLFHQGGLEQNRTLAPDDYLYFPPLGLEEVYVLGEVGTAGAVPYTTELTLIGAIAARGGFKEAAFWQKILVVRGSLQQPETYVIDRSGVDQVRATLAVAAPEVTTIDTARTLRAAAPDFALKPRDIIYVSKKPWAKAEELLEAASSDFVRAVVVAWTGQNIKPLSR